MAWPAGAVSRVADQRARWRVVVDAWQHGSRYEGRLVFEPDGAGADAPARATATVLRGDSAEDVVASALDIPEKRLRELLNSLR